MKTTPGPAHKESIARARAAGREARTSLPRRDFAVLTLPERDPVGILEGQHASRLADLIPVRVGRMLETPFSFYRGAAAAVAHDLADSPVTGHTLIASGDAHLANFGLFASPERRLIFDLNDFDEAYPAPWEWDIKRLAASIWLNGRNSSHTEEQCGTAVRACVRRYRQALKALYSHTATERYYFQVDAENLAARQSAARKRIKTEEKKARQRTSEQVLTKLTATTESGEPGIVDQPPLVRHPLVMDHAAMESLVETYRETLRPDTSLLLSQYRLVDFARRIVGVDSVGTRSWVILFEGPAGEPLFLQAKEAGKSVLETHGRVLHAPEPVEKALITRGKGSFTLAEMNAQETSDYGSLCRGLLARAHSQSTGSAFILEYLGGSDAFDDALADWARNYADQTESDHAALEQAVQSGRLPAERGV